jgi:hypothetical protein
MQLKKNLSNIIGWRSNRKIVVIESDDWGSIRTRSKSDYEQMLSEGLNVDYFNFGMYDCLESNSDLENLYSIILKYKDCTGRPPVITPMCIMANPDFDKIENADFKEYYFEPFIETYKKYSNHDKVHEYWMYGIKNRLFVPSLHGREHLNVARFLKILKDENSGLRKCFNHRSFGATRYKGQAIGEYLGAFYPDDVAEISELDKIMEDAVSIFSKFCGFVPTHFIAPNKESPKVLDRTLADLGIMNLTMAKIRRYPLGCDRHNVQINWLGRKNEYGQTIIIRNCHFEPSDWQQKKSADSCLNEIQIAFNWNKPAIISTHRVNYVGQLCEENAINGLKELEYLISTILKKWPDVEFMTSTELGKIIVEDLNY